jgi:NADH:ubiquinone oxidoreductase subunit E
MVISVCVGSSCHLKGAYRIIEELKGFIADRCLEDRVELKANFCAGLCQHAVSIRVDDSPCIQVDEENLYRFLHEHITGRL